MLEKPNVVQVCESQRIGEFETKLTAGALVNNVEERLGYAPQVTVEPCHPIKVTLQCQKSNSAFDRRLWRFAEGLGEVNRRLRLSDDAQLMLSVEDDLRIKRSTEVGNCCRFRKTRHQPSEELEQRIRTVQLRTAEDMPSADIPHMERAIEM